MLQRAWPGSEPGRIHRSSELVQKVRSWLHSSPMTPEPGHDQNAPNFLHFQLLTRVYQLFPSNYCGDLFLLTCPRLFGVSSVSQNAICLPIFCHLLYNFCLVSIQYSLLKNPFWKFLFPKKIFKSKHFIFCLYSKTNIQIRKHLHH